MLKKHWHLAMACLISFIGLIFVLIEPYSSQVLTYTRVGIFEGELWRLLSCNFHHTNLNHLVMNGAGLIVITLLHQEHYKKYSQLTLLAIIGTLMAITLLIVEPKLSAYLGLSGALHGLFAWGVIADIRKGDKTGYLLMIGLIIKLLWEGIYGPAASTEAMIGAKVATNSHLVGAIWGTLLALLQPKLKL